MLLLTAAAALTVLLLALALSGHGDLALFVAPVGLFFASLLSGRFVGEDRLARHWQARGTRRLRPARLRWTHGRARALTSSLERSPLCRRGPPAAPAPAH